MALTLTLTEHVVGFRAPLPTSWGVLDRRRLFLVELVGSDGVVGRGEAAPLGAYDGVSDDTCRAALTALAAELATIDESEPGHLILDRLTAVTDCAPALSAIDMAMWDRGGRREGRPVSALLASTALEAIAVHKTIGGVSAGDAGATAAEAVAAGFTAFKVKVGLRGDNGAPDLDGDVARVAAVRAAAGPDARIKVDANGAGSVDEAVEALRRLTGRGVAIDAAEEPVSGGDAWPHLRAALNAAKIVLELSIDETADREPGAITRGPDVVELKLARTGGIGPLLVRASLAQIAGVQVALSSTFDGPLGIAAALHAAAALGIERPLGLGTLDALDLSGAPDLAELATRLEPVDGRIMVPTGPGLL
ncbi:MAG: mandelate racemase/muconate lactonizing enzyme family protein [Solirubrobacteraceae bacterium]|nr:mandelate racemase/muconate lactonizing enzyme family protein [Solirubrobacteraceae bacterium]